MLEMESGGRGMGKLWADWLVGRRRGEGEEGEREREVWATFGWRKRKGEMGR